MKLLEKVFVYVESESGIVLQSERAIPSEMDMFELYHYSWGCTKFSSLAGFILKINQKWWNQYRS